MENGGAQHQRVSIWRRVLLDSVRFWEYSFLASGLPDIYYLGARALPIQVGSPARQTIDPGSSLESGDNV